MRSRFLMAFISSTLLIPISTAFAGDKFVAGDKFSHEQQAVLEDSVRQLQTTVEALTRLLIARGVATAAELQEVTASIQAEQGPDLVSRDDQDAKLTGSRTEAKLTGSRYESKLTGSRSEAALREK